MKTTTSQKKREFQPTLLNLKPMDLARFVWIRDEGELIGEASSFGPAREGQWWLQRLYAEATDIGILVRNERTGREERFFMAGEDVNEDGEILAWRFYPVNFGSSPVYQVIIFND